MINRLGRIIAVVTGTCGFLLATLTVLVLTGQDIRLPGVVGPSLLIIAAGLCTGIWAVLSAEFRRLPFWITFVFGVVLILLSLDYWGEHENNIISQFYRQDILALAGYTLLIISRLAAAKAYLSARRFLATVGLLSLGSVVALSALIPTDTVETDLSYIEGRDALIALLHPEAGDYIEDIDDFVDDLLDDKTLDPSGREAEIRALNERIQAMEAELALFEATRDQNAAQAAEIEALRNQVAIAMKRVAEAESRPDGNGGIIVTLDGEEVRRVQSFRAAVRPEMPMVRDFAVALASSFPGSYYRNDGDPYGVSFEGMKQIIAIHGYISGEWKYVNDPTSIGADYYSPAHRTIAAGLAGDCDDFSILVSSAIEAVGGKTRIMGGSCSGGYHAWPEVYIGSKAAFNDAMKIIAGAYPGRTIQYTTDTAGGHWLCLDWQLGTYSCGKSAHVLYQRIGGVFHDPRNPRLLEFHVLYRGTRRRCPHRLQQGIDP
jgi:hypothetical protein